MISRTAWFDRNFPTISDNGLFPGIFERMAGTPARLKEKFAKTKAELMMPGHDKWSVKKEVGHLIDLEPLWYERALQIIGGETDLIKADLTNRKTHETNHDAEDIQHLIDRFKAERDKLLEVLWQATEQDLEKSAIHPRLKTPMKLIDLAYFVAEHDDHHLAQITLLIKGQ